MQRSALPFVRRLVLLPVAGLGLLLAPAGVRAADEQAWNNLSLQAPLTGGWRLLASGHRRARQLDHSDRFLWNLNLGLARDLAPGFYAGVAYKREVTDRGGFDLRENRLVLEAGWARPLAGAARFDLRSRSELRSFESGRGSDGLRLRLRARLRRKVTLGGVSFEPFVATELFSDTDGGELLDRNRLTLGASVPIHPAVTLSANYLRQDDAGEGKALNVLETGLHLKF